MKRALIEPSGRVAQVEAEDFPVAPPLRWVDCADEVTPGTHYYDGQAVVEIPPRQPTKDERNAPILAALAKSDAAMVRAIEEGDAEKIAERRAERQALRGQLVK